MIECQGSPDAVRIWPRKGNIDDAVLLSAVAGGDHEAYTTLYDRYGATLLGLLCRIVRSRTEAEDVLQDVFLQPTCNQTARWLAAGSASG